MATEKKYIRRWFHRDISRSTAIIISTAAHLVALVVVRNIDFEKDTGLPVIYDSPIYLDFTVEEKIEFEKNSNDEDFTNQDNSSATEDLLEPKSSATNGTEQNVEGNVTQQRQMVMLASLSMLDEMRADFNFMSRKQSPDSVGAFSPVQGLAPDTKSLWEALNSGLLKVAGFGRGNCKPRGGKIF